MDGRWARRPDGFSRRPPEWEIGGNTYIVAAKVAFQQNNNLFGQLMAVLDVQFVQRLDVLVDESNRNDDEVLLALFHVALKRIVVLVYHFKQIRVE